MDLDTHKVTYRYKDTMLFLGVVLAVGEKKSPTYWNKIDWGDFVCRMYSIYLL
jgi:hypothetical protein